MRSLISRSYRDLIVLGILLALPLGLFWQTTLGGKTLIPADNLYQWEPWASYADEMAVGVAHNDLLSDLVLENYAWKRFILDSLRQPGGLTNRLPLWNPYLWAGAPFLGDGQHSAMYPFSVLFYVLPLPRAYGWFTVLQFWLAGAFMYVLARVLGTGRVGGLVAGIVYQLSAVYVVSVVFTMIIASMAWLPLLVALVEIVIRAEMGPQNQGRSGRTLLYVAGGALALGCQMLAGHPEFTYYTGLIMGLYALARLIQAVIAERGQKSAWLGAAKAGAWLLLMVALGACIGAAQFVPLYEYAASSSRQGSESYETIVGWAFPARRAIAMLVPNFFGNPSQHAWFDLLRWQWMPVVQNIYGEPTQPPHTIYWGIKNAVEGGCYVGILPLFLALIAILGRWPARGRHPKPTLHGRSRFYVWFLAALAAFSISLVFGLPTYRLVFALPGISQLHSPFRWLFPYTFSVAALAGLGFTHLASRRQVEGTGERSAGPDARRIIGWLALGAGAVGIGALSIALGFADRLYPLAEQAVRSLARADLAFASGRMFFMYQWPNLFLLALMLVLSGIVLVVSRCPVRLPGWLGGRPLYQPLAVAVVALDLFVAGYGFNPAADPRLLDFTPPSIAFLQARQAEDPYFRVTSYNAPGEKTLNANTPWLYGLQDVRGYGSLISKQYVGYMERIYPQYELLYNRIAPIPTDHPEALDSPLLDLLNVRYVVTTQKIESPRYRMVYDGKVRIYENRECMPRAFVLPETSVVYTDDVARAVREYDPRHYVILEGDGGTVTATARAISGTAIPAAIRLYTNNEVWVDVDLDAPGWLILADSYFPGWRAYVRPLGGQESDEKELPIQRHSGNLRAVPLQAGQYTVRWKYTPTSVKVGFFLSFLGGMILAMILATWLWRRFVRGGDEVSDARRVARNSLAPIVLQLFNKAIDTGFMMLALRILAPQGQGQYYFLVNIATYTDVFINFGLNIYLQREVAKARTEGNRYLGNAILVRMGLCLVAAPLLVLFVVLWPVFTGGLASLGWASGAEYLDARQIWALAFFAIGLIPSNIAAALTALFQANERMEHPAAITVISTIVKAGLGTAALLAGWGIVGLGGVSIVTNLVTVAILGVLTMRLFFRPRFASDWAMQREMVRESWPLMVNNLLAMGFFKADVILLKAMQGDVVLGLYSGVAYKLIDAINIVPSSFTVALFPLMSRYANGARQERGGAMYRAYLLAVRLLVMVALPVALVLTVLAYPLSTLIGGSGYMPDSAIALQLMIWSIPLGFVNSVTHYLLIALGRQRPLMVTFTIGLVFNIAANVVCIPIWGYRASAVIHILSELVLLVAFYVLLRRDLPAVGWPALLWRPAVAGALMGACGWWLYGVNKILATIVALGVYAASLWALGITREPDMEIVVQLLPKIGWLRRLVAAGKR